MQFFLTTPSWNSLPHVWVQNCSSVHNLLIFLAPNTLLPLDEANTSWAAIAINTGSDRANGKKMSWARYIAQQVAHQLVGPRKALHHSTQQLLQTFVSLVVILCQTVAGLFDSAGWTHLCTVMQYSGIFCSRPEAASDLISSHFVILIVANCLQ